MAPDRDRITVRGGSGVEAREGWFCEAAWNGRFRDGDFDQTDIVAGSGGRCRDDGVIFVSSGSILDRLHFMSAGDATLVSNSLSALAAETDAVVDPTYRWYHEDLASIFDGLGNHVDRLTTSQGDIRLVYYENLSWDGKELGPSPKPRIERDFSSFEKYLGFLQSEMNAVIANANDGSRSSALEPLIAISSGYDSPAVAVIARNAGVRDAFTVTLNRDGVDDSGARIGNLLGYEMEEFDRQVWRTLDRPEIDCIAGSGGAGEVVFAGYSDRIRGRLLLTGLWGGTPWKGDQKDVRPIFAGHDGSGLCFTEMRLNIGFVHCPVPFWGGLQIADIARIGRSEELQPWSLSQQYNRPISRRIVESAGVPRDWFGQKKYGASDILFGPRDFLTESSVTDYSAWIRSNAGAWLRKGRIPPYRTFGRIFDGLLAYVVLPFLKRIVVPVLRRCARLPVLSGMQPWIRSLRGWIRQISMKPLFFRRYTFPWALSRSKEKYLQGTGNARRSGI